MGVGTKKYYSTAHRKTSIHLEIDFLPTQASDPSFRPQAIERKDLSSISAFM